MKKIDFEDLGLSGEIKEEAGIFKGLFLARVSARHKDIYRVFTEYGEIFAQISGKISFGADLSADYPAVGDWVMADRETDDRGYAVIRRILKRKSALAREAAGTSKDVQVLAANIDIVFICMSCNRDFNISRLERYLSIAWESGAVPVVVLTKTDLPDNPGKMVMEAQAAAIGADVVLVTSLGKNGYDGIKKYLKKGVTIVFVGSSGVGKSTIVNRLLGREAMATREIREDDERGRHMTTHRQMFMVEGGGIVIDTPGLRELKIPASDISKTFYDIGELSQRCRFSDCRHESEPGCAVRKAIEDGVLSERRLKSYNKLKQEMLHCERKTNMGAAQAEKLKIIDMMGSLDALKKYKNKK